MTHNLQNTTTIFNEVKTLIEESKVKVAVVVYTLLGDCRTSDTTIEVE